VRELSVREANQNFSQVIAAAEGGETIIITKNGRPVARIAPQGADRAQDPEWRAAYEQMAQRLRRKAATGYRVGRIAEDDKYGDDPA
jgi:prevent-host-death family protein